VFKTLLGIRVRAGCGRKCGNNFSFLSQFTKGDSFTKYGLHVEGGRPNSREVVRGLAFSSYYVLLIKIERTARSDTRRGDTHTHTHPHARADDTYTGPAEGQGTHHSPHRHRPAQVAPNTPPHH
jgi:hypothetical protein